MVKAGPTTLTITTLSITSLSTQLYENSPQWIIETPSITLNFTLMSSATFLAVVLSVVKLSVIIVSAIRLSVLAPNILNFISVANFVQQ